jgi:hypothetical protein
MSTHRATDLRHVNQLTQCYCALGLPIQRAPALEPRAAFVVAHERLTLIARAATQAASASAAAKATQRAMAIVVVDSQARVCQSLLVHDQGAVIAGRHTSCGLRLDGDTISLRQLAVLVRSEGGCLQAHVRDLATSAPFVTEDGERNTAVVAEGPLYLAIEGYALWLVPVGADLELPASAEDAFAALPARRFIDRRPPDDSSLVRRVGAIIPHRSERVSAVTSLAPPLMLGDDDEPEVGWGTIRIQHGAHREKRTVTAERLESGVLLGRYERCGLVLSGPRHYISRVHALLLRVGAEVWVVDTASTNGIWRRSERVGCAVLQDDDHLSLAKEVMVSWHRTHHPEA